MSWQAFPMKVRTQIWNKSEGLCWYCGHDLDFERFDVDHVIPTSRGGGSEIENLVPACPSCNRRKHAHDIEGFRNVMSRKSHYHYFNRRQKAWLLEHYGIDIEADTMGEPYVFWFEKAGVTP